MGEKYAGLSCKKTKELCFFLTTTKFSWEEKSRVKFLSSYIGFASEMQ